MDGNLKRVLQALSPELRHLLEGEYDATGEWHGGDLEQRLAALGVWRDRDPLPADELPHLTPSDREARDVVDAYLAVARRRHPPRPGRGRVRPRDRLAYIGSASISVLFRG